MEAVNPVDTTKVSTAFSSTKQENLPHPIFVRLAHSHKTVVVDLEDLAASERLEARLRRGFGAELPPKCQRKLYLSGRRLMMTD